MTHYTELTAASAGGSGQRADVLRLATAAYLARYKGTSRIHMESDLRIYFGWCAERGLDPLAVERPHLELHVRWMQEIRRFQPSTVSRRLSVIAGFYRTCVIDGILAHSPAEYVRRPAVPAESPTLGFTHLQFEALLTTARDSANPYDFALVAMLGLLGLRIFEATGADVGDLGEEHGHRVLRVCGKGGKVVLVPLPPAVGRAIDRAIAGRGSGPLLLNNRGARMDRHAATRRLRHLATAAGVQIGRAHPHMLRHTFGHHHARRRRGPARRTDRGPPRRPQNHNALRPRPKEPRPPSQLHPRRLYGLGHLTRPSGKSQTPRDTTMPMTVRSFGVCRCLYLHIHTRRPPERFSRRNSTIFTTPNSKTKRYVRLLKTNSTGIGCGGSPSEFPLGQGGRNTNASTPA